MGKSSSAPSYNPPTPPKLPTAQDLFSQASTFGQSQMPNAYGAREGALNDLSKGNSYYDQFQSTSFEQALGNQYFQNVWPDTQAAIKHGLSMSGIESSPVLGSMLGKARGDLGFNIGSYLSGQANNRAQNSLTERLGIDPMRDILNPYANIGQQQGNNQANAQYGYDQQVAQSQYQQAMQKFNQQQALYKTVGQFSPLGGALYGGISGGQAGLGSSLSGTADSFNAILPYLMMSGYGNMSSSVNPSKPATYAP